MQSKNKTLKGPRLIEISSHLPESHTSLLFPLFPPPLAPISTIFVTADVGKQLGDRARRLCEVQSYIISSMSGDGGVFGNDDDNHNAARIGSASRLSFDVTLPGVRRAENAADIKCMRVLSNEWAPGQV